MNDNEVEVGMKVRLLGYEVWKVTRCFLSLCRGELYWQITRGCCRKLVKASSLVPYN